MTKTIRSKTVTVDLLDGRLDERSVLHVAGWNGCVYSFPRGVLEAPDDRKELRGMAGRGVYVLWRASQEGNKAKVHLGMGAVRRRLKRHAKKASFWDRAAVLVTTDKRMSKGVAEDLEARLIELAHRAPGWDVANDKRMRRSHLSSFDRAESDHHLDRLRVCLTLLGLDFLDETPTHPSEPILLALEGKGVRASGYLSTAGFTVCVGSQMVGREEVVDSLPDSLKRLREQLIREQFVNKEGSRLVFAKEWRTSLSTAAKVIEGRSVNGRDAWKDPMGRSPNGWGL